VETGFNQMIQHGPMQQIALPLEIHALPAQDRPTGQLI